MVVYVQNSSPKSIFPACRWLIFGNSRIHLNLFLSSLQSLSRYDRLLFFLTQITILRNIPKASVLITIYRP
jgi:hypothetical protein